MTGCRRIRSRPIGCTLAAIAVATVFISACSSSTGASTSATSGATPSEGSSSSAAEASSCRGTPATGTPYEFGSLLTLSGPSTTRFQDTENGEMAAADCLNDAGGINGHPIRITPCDDADDPATARTCAQNFVQQKVLAVIGGQSALGDNEALTVLQSAGIPMIGQVPLESSDFSNPFSFPINRGTAGMFQALPSFLIQKGKKRLSIIYANFSVAKTAADQLAATFKALGGQAVKEIPLDPTALALGPVVTAATAGFNPDVVANLYSGTQCVPAMAAEQAAGLQSSAMLFWVNSCNTPTLLKAAGSAINGGYFNGNYPDPNVQANSNNPQVALFLAAMSKFESGQPQNTAAADAFSVPYFVKSIIATIPSGTQPTSASIVTALHSANNIPILMGGEYTWDPNQGSQKQYPTLAVGAAAFIQYNNGVFAQSTKWINGFRS
jgi:branched-chain amino acid transport system substrate-binding protein